MNWPWAAAAPAVVSAVYAATRQLAPAILAYHLLCAAAIVRHRARIKTLFRWEHSTPRWVLGTTLLIAAGLAVGPLLRDPAPYKPLFLSAVLPWEPRGVAFALFAVYTLVVHAPLEEIFWRAAAMDPDRLPAGRAAGWNGGFFHLLHAIPLAMLLGAEGWLLGLPAGLAGAMWAFVQVRSRSLWPGLVSHWVADALILWGMWFYFLR